MMLAQKRKETKKTVVSESPWNKEEAYEKYKSHLKFLFEPNFQTDVLTDLNSDFIPRFQVSFHIDEILDILVIYINHYVQNKCPNNNGGNKPKFTLV